MQQIGRFLFDLILQRIFRWSFSIWLKKRNITSTTEEKKPCNKIFEMAFTRKPSIVELFCRKAPISSLFDHSNVDEAKIRSLTCHMCNGNIDERKKKKNPKSIQKYISTRQFISNRILRADGTQFEINLHVWPLAIRKVARG